MGEGKYTLFALKSAKKELTSVTHRATISASKQASKQASKANPALVFCQALFHKYFRRSALILEQAAPFCVPEGRKRKGACAA